MKSFFLTVLLLIASVGTTDALFCDRPIFQRIFPVICPGPEPLPFPAKCSDLLTNANRFGKSAYGLDLRNYTGGTLEWIGVFNDEYPRFFCMDYEDAMMFGSHDAMHAVTALIDPANENENSDPRNDDSCATAGNPSNVANAPSLGADARALCEALGYSDAQVLFVEDSPSGGDCPVVQAVGGDPLYWFSNFQQGSNYGLQFLCTGNGS